jgi:S-(hydroxymethyl)glutathione dehydrogenase/alcohol dehydrogenase
LRLQSLQGLRLAGADMIIGVDINNDRKAWGERFGMTHFVNPKEIEGDIVAHLVNMTKRGADQIGGADYTFDCTGNTKVMRQALESSHRGWGKSVIIGVAGAGQEISTRPFQLVTGRTSSAARAAAQTCRRSSTGTWTARSRSTR